ncbi:MBOAT family protein [Mucilaginibacter sp. UR6-11]|uniref:MBOAT family O-acyltransferase n=1 Tax=Mucilaginibacter sp. UR6-11 TaxID=1435644 RepID=UPI001E28B6F4|nr:MBOAT family O-acyltransferase [Mucilaginibacter sp. UR6-11]MCC8426352.1 MBOAT family protein [Mucilaginibacter sp. UR6-11]
MLFNSLIFLNFFVVVTTLYFLVPDKHQWKLLLLASCYFYMFFVPVYLLILGFTIVIDYYAGILIERKTGSKKKLMLIVSLMANVGVLAVFKYYNFIANNLSFLLKLSGVHHHIPYLNILLPIGLSFHTFQAMSYTIEVYRGHQKPERNFGIYALYVMFYPQLVAGPIERPQNMLPQFHQKHAFNYDDVVTGLRKMLWGYFKKLVVADRLAIYVNAVFHHPGKHSAITLITAIIFFSFQIYCDFSGYSDIALGTARVMGYKLMVNFRRPYFATSIKEFWSRWHISLSTWFRDYLYIPLGGNRRSISRWCLNILLVFMISGLWHGASWTFVVWGALHGFYLIAGIFFNKVFKDRFLIIKNTVTGIFFRTSFTFMIVCFGWIFFRANSIDDAFIIIRNIVTWKGGGFYIGSISDIFYSIVALAILLITEYTQEFYSESFSLMNSRYKLVRHLSYVAIILLILLAGILNQSQFIYFQF